MYVPQDSMWQEILKTFWFQGELNRPRSGEVNTGATGSLVSAPFLCLSLWAASVQRSAGASSRTWAGCCGASARSPFWLLVSSPVSLRSVLNASRDMCPWTNQTVLLLLCVFVCWPAGTEGVTTEAPNEIILSFFFKKRERNYTGCKEKQRARVVSKAQNFFLKKND